MNTFQSLGLSSETLKVLDELGFETPSKIQEECIPSLLKEERDCIGLAQTGTGKTAAFGLPLLEKIDTQNPSIQALVLAPTRELGRQIAEQLFIFSKYMKGLKVLPVYGGADINRQIKRLKENPQIVIATPGRLIDLAKRKAIVLEDIQQVVLDEADEMLNMGFKEDIDYILGRTAHDKKIWLFSATLPKSMKKLVDSYMRNPLRFEAHNPNEVNTKIEHKFVIVKQSNRAEGLARFLDMNPDIKGVAFCRTRRDTRDVADYLISRDYKADAIHGDLSQRERDRVMNKFRNQEIQVLVATDVAARGIDVNDLTHVFHLAIPDDLAYYTHRSGRTARAGKEGISVAFIGKNDKSMLHAIERKLNISFEKAYVPQAVDIVRYRLMNWCRMILDTPANQFKENPYGEEAMMLFENLSKEELLAKVLHHQYQHFKISGNKDLNESFSSGGRKKRGRSGGGRSHRKSFKRKRSKSKNNNRR